LRAGLAEFGLIVWVAGLHRFLMRRGMTQEDKDRPCHRAGPARHLEAAAIGFDGQLDLEPDRLFFIYGSAADAEGIKPGPPPT